MGKDAEAAKFSLDRHLTMAGSFRKPELAAVDKVEVLDPLTVQLLLKAPFSPLIAQLSDRAGMIISPKAARDAIESAAAGLDEDARVELFSAYDDVLRRKLSDPVPVPVETGEVVVRACLKWAYFG